jgi:hypothetical protein
MNPIIFEQSENPSTCSPKPWRRRKPRIAGQVRSRASLTFHCLLLLILAFVPPASLANPPVLVAADGTFLGVASANPFDLDSISNPFGLYGSEYSATSINNPYSLYGSEFSTESTTNPFLVSEPLEK